MSVKKKWSELSSRNRRLLAVLGVIEVVLLAAAHWDIKHRPPEKINGSKWMWRALTLVDIIGPLAYFAFGRRRGADA